MVTLIEREEHEHLPGLPEKESTTEVQNFTKRVQSNVAVSAPAVLPATQRDFIPVPETASISEERIQEDDISKRGEVGFSDVSPGGIEGTMGGSTEVASEGNVWAPNSDWYRYRDEVIRRIEQGKRYPLLAQMREMKGVVVVGFTIRAGGEATSLELVRSSQEGLLDQEALDTIRRVSPFPPLPMESGLSKVRVTIALKFNLKDQ